MSNLPRVLYYLNRAMHRLKWSQTELKKYQLQQLRQIVNNAYSNVPFYHAKFKTAGVHPNDIQTLKDLTRLPIIEKSEFRLQPRDNIVSKEFLNRKMRVVSTSGSTGKPFSIHMTHKEDDWRKAIYMRANTCCGQKLRDKWMVIVGPNHFSKVTRLQQILGIYTRNCVSVLEDVSTQLSLAQNMKPQVLDGYSSSLLMLAKEAKKTGKNLTPRIIFGNGEVMPKSSQEYVEEVFHAPYYDQYGCGEFNRTAWQCPEKMGYHMDEDSVIAQFVDEDGNEVSPGESGEIVYTSLFNYAMPFIRYKVGDLGIPSNETCKCGRTLPLMKAVEGRKDSLIFLPNGKSLSPRLFTITMSMYKLYEKIEQFRIIQKKIDFIEILIKPTASMINPTSMINEIITHFNNTLNLKECEVTIDVKIVKDIPITKNGKLMSVVSELKRST